MAKVFIDETLTIENCKSKGFEWWQDTIYDLEAPKGANNEFEQFITRGWKFGRPSSKNFEQNNSVGLYRPI